MIASYRSRTCREKNQYIVHVPIPRNAKTSPARLQLGEPAEASPTITTPTKDVAASTHARTDTRSPSRYAETTTITTGASAPISATSATVVRLTAVNPRPMSAANSTPPSAHARKAPQVSLRRVTAMATPDTHTPAHRRSIANVGPGRSLHFTSTGPHAHTNVAIQTAARPRRCSRSDALITTHLPSGVVRTVAVATLPGMREHTGTALGIAAIATFGYTIWAAVIAIIMWLSLTIYAVVKW